MVSDVNCGLNIRNAFKILNCGLIIEMVSDLHCGLTLEMVSKF